MVIFLLNFLLENKPYPNPLILTLHFLYVFQVSPISGVKTDTDISQMTGPTPQQCIKSNASTATRGVWRWKRDGSGYWAEAMLKLSTEQHQWCSTGLKAPHLPGVQHPAPPALCHPICTMNQSWMNHLPSSRNQEETQKTQRKRLKTLLLLKSRCAPLWSLVSPHQKTPPADLSSTGAPRQGFPNATMTMLLTSISRGASEWTTRKLAPSSSPSACLWMTTLPRLWETSGCRLKPSLPPALPHRPAVQVSLTLQPTDTARISPAKSPPAAHRRLPAIGLLIKARNDLWYGKKTVTLNISLRAALLVQQWKCQR